MMELLVVIAIASILTGLAVPSFRAGIQSAESRDAATAFYTALTRARSEAIAVNAQVSVCARDATKELTKPGCVAPGATAAWKDGWIVYADATPDVAIVVHEPIANGLSLGSVTSPLTFDASGRTATTRFNLCRQPVADTNGRRISLSRSGRVALEPTTC